MAARKRRASGSEPPAAKRAKRALDEPEGARDGFLSGFACLLLADKVLPAQVSIWTARVRESGGRLAVFADNADRFSPTVPALDASALTCYSHLITALSAAELREWLAARGLAALPPPLTAHTTAFLTYTLRRRVLLDRQEHRLPVGGESRHTRVPSVTPAHVSPVLAAALKDPDAAPLLPEARRLPPPAPLLRRPSIANLTRSVNSLPLSSRPSPTSRRLSAARAPQKAMATREHASADTDGSAADDFEYTAASLGQDAALGFQQQDTSAQADAERGTRTRADAHGREVVRDGVRATSVDVLVGDAESSEGAGLHARASAKRPSFSDADNELDLLLATSARAPSRAAGHAADAAADDSYDDSQCREPSWSPASDETLEFEVPAGAVLKGVASAARAAAEAPHGGSARAARALDVNVNVDDGSERSDASAQTGDSAARLDASTAAQIQVERDKAARRANRSKREQWACQKAFNLVGQDTGRVNHNALICDKLGELIRLYESEGETFKAVTTRKAIARIAHHPRPLSSGAEARASIFGVGVPMATKIQEILDTGTLGRLEFTSNDERHQVIALFCKVFGIGRATALLLYTRGRRTLDDLRAHAAELTAAQRIGLEFFDDLQLRIPRDEVTAIQEVVAVELRRIDAAVVAVTCGSYRRGQPTCGDVDVLITHPTNFASLVRQRVLAQLVITLKARRFITAELTVSGRRTTRGDSSDRFMGICQLRPGLPHRRIDFKLVPYDEWGPALLYFTGSDHFNRSMRLWATRAGFSLNEKALVRLIAPGVKAELPVPGLYTEQDVFRALGLSYRRPSERNV